MSRSANKRLVRRTKSSRIRKSRLNKSKRAPRRRSVSRSRTVRRTASRSKRPRRTASRSKRSRRTASRRDLKVNQKIKNKSKYSIQTDSIFYLKDDNFDYFTVSKNTILFRGQKTDENKNRPTYFANEPNNAIEYLKTNQKGYLKIFKTIKTLNLFEINESNINKLLTQLFHDKSIIRPKKFTQTLYEVIRFIFTGIYKFQPEKTAYKIKKITRNSCYDQDIIFSNWLCANGFHGYYASDLSQKLTCDFPGEIMLCDPLATTKEIKSIHMKKTKKILKIEDLLK